MNDDADCCVHYTDLPVASGTFAPRQTSPLVLNTNSNLSLNVHTNFGLNKTGYRPEGGETTCSPPMAVQLAADLRPSADRSAVRPASCRQPACL